MSILQFYCYYKTYNNFYYNFYTHISSIRCKFVRPRDLGIKTKEAENKVISRMTIQKQQQQGKCPRSRYFLLVTEMCKKRWITEVITQWQRNVFNVFTSMLPKVAVSKSDDITGQLVSHTLSDNNTHTQTIYSNRATDKQHLCTFCYFSVSYSLSALTALKWWSKCKLSLFMCF